MMASAAARRSGHAPLQEFSSVVELVKRLTPTCDGCPDASGVVSNGDPCAGTLLSTDTGHLPRFTFLDVINRLEARWPAAVLVANREGCERPKSCLRTTHGTDESFRGYRLGRTCEKEAT